MLNTQGVIGCAPKYYRIFPCHLFTLVTRKIKRSLSHLAISRLAYYQQIVQVVHIHPSLSFTYLGLTQALPQQFLAQYKFQPSAFLWEKYKFNTRYSPSKVLCDSSMRLQNPPIVVKKYQHRSVCLTLLTGFTVVCYTRHNVDSGFHAYYHRLHSHLV